MEAVPRLPMIKFELKISPEKTSFDLLKQQISKYYNEDSEAYSKEFTVFDTLRRYACSPPKDMEGLGALKRYYCQLNSLQNRFNVSDAVINFTWRDVYTGGIHQNTSIKYEMAAVLYNIGALHTQLGMQESRTDSESLKIACTHFQCAAWAFGHIKENYPLVIKDDLSIELMVFKQQLCLAHAQECILEKSLTDNRKSALIAKVTAQIIIYYNSALATLLNNTEDGQELSQIITNKYFKEYRKYIKFKIFYLSAILYLYQGQESEELQKMGERVILYQSAADKLEEAKKESKGMQNIDAINESLVFTTDVIEGKLKIAKNENDFIYHEEIPELVNISAIKGANLVNGIGFSITDPKIVGEDIFQRLIPMKVHETSSLYSEEKANLLRNISAKVESKNDELNAFVGSLNLELLQQYQQQTINFDRLPDGLVDRCAAINAKTNAISDLVQSMANLAEICSEVEMILSDIKNLLHDEEVDESKYQEKTGGLRSSGGNNMTELNREFLKYNEAHSKAGESNETLRKAMGLHVANLKILAQPLQQLQQHVPKVYLNLEDPSIKALSKILDKVDEMRKQREQVYSQLRQAINEDDITSILICCNDKTSFNEIFAKELEKHQPSIQIIEQNLTAQKNILKMFSSVYANSAQLIKNLNDTKMKREHFFSSLSASYDVYEDLLSKCSKGLEFYKKLQINVQKLHSRIKAAHDVQDEERQQRLKASRTEVAPDVVKPVQPVTTKSSGHRLKDYLNSEGKISTTYSNSILPVRPNPLGSENATPGISNYNYYANSMSGQNVNASPQMNVEYNASAYYNNPATDMNSQINLSNSSHSISQTYPTNQTPFSNSPSAMGYTNPIYQNPGYLQQTEMPKQSYGVSANTEAYQDSTQKPDASAFNSQLNIVSQNFGNLDLNQAQTFNQYNLQNTNPPAIEDYSRQNVASDYNAYNTMSTNPYSSNNTSSMPQTQYYGNYTDLSQQQVVADLTASQMQQQTMHSYIPTNTVQQSVSYSSHPGYSLNPQTGAYDYNSGYQVDNMSNNQEYVSQYTNPIPQYNQTYSNVNNYGISSNSVSQTYTQPEQEQTMSQQPTNVQSNYYNVPYGQNNVAAAVDTNLYSSNQYQNSYENKVLSNVIDSGLVAQNQYQNIYMNSNTTTTNSNNGYSLSSSYVTQNIPAQLQNIEPPQANLQPINQIAVIQPPEQTRPEVKAPEVKPATVTVLQHTSNSKNIDLLSGIDFSNNTSTMDTPTLEPLAIVKDEIIAPLPLPISSVSTTATLAVDNKITETENSKDLDSLSQNYDWGNDKLDSISNESIKPSNSNRKVSKETLNPFEDPSTLKWFHKEVERLERFIETFMIKTLNGTTPLDSKWKEIHDSLEKDETKKSVTVARLFPEKNRSIDSLPYDHSRVLLPTSTDDYINAVHLKNLGANSPNYILAQTPMPNTINDFWNMIWSQKANTCICLHTPNELLDKFWPSELNVDCSYGDLSVTFVKQTELSNCIEYSLKLALMGNDHIANIKLLQIKSWPKKRPENIISIAHNIITTYKEQNSGVQENTPLVLNCLTGAERCSFVTVAVTTILATETKRPTLINVSDVWYRICSQRKDALRDIGMLQESYNIVLSHGHSILNKRGIMTSYQITTDITKKEYKEEVCDPLNDLDPLWKLK